MLLSLESSTLMKTKQSTLLFLLIFLLSIQLVMLTAAGVVPVAQSARLPEPQSEPTLDLLQAIGALAGQADLVIQAQVVQAKSRWNHTHTLIETAHTLAVQQNLAGKVATEVVVYTEGGFLADEGLGMASSHTPRFAVGEAVLVFLHEVNGAYQVVGGEAGKFTVLNADAVSAYYREHLPVAQVAAILATRNSTNRRLMLPLIQQSGSAISAQRVQAGNAQPLATVTPTPLPKWSGATPTISLQVNLKSTQIGSQSGSAEQFLAAIKNALRTWSVVPEAGATLLYDGETSSATTGFNQKSEILFMKKGANSQLGQAQIWFTSGFVIVEADLWINDDYIIDATGSPENSEIDLESVVLHELGHWLPLSHLPNTDAVMYAVLGAGMRKTLLNSDDIAGITALYPCPVIPCIDPAYAGDVTATPTPSATVSITITPEMTATPTATITPTLTPTLIPSASTPTAQQNSFLPLVTR